VQTYQKWKHCWIKMIDWISEKLNLLTNKNKNVIIYPDTLEKQNRRVLKGVQKDEQIISDVKVESVDPIYEKIHDTGRNKPPSGTD